MFHFYTPWRRPKTFGFLKFSGGIEIEYGLKWIKNIVCHENQDRCIHMVICYFHLNRQEKQINAFFINNTFISNVRLKLAKNQANAKQHPGVDLLLFENYLLSSSTLLSKSNKKYSKKCATNKCVYFNEVTWLMTMKVRLKMKSRSQIYDITRPRLRHGHKYT